MVTTHNTHTRAHARTRALSLSLISLTHTHTRTHYDTTQTHAHTHTHTLTPPPHTHTLIYTRTLIYTHIHTHTHTHTHNRYGNSVLRLIVTVLASRVACVEAIDQQSIMMSPAVCLPLTNEFNRHKLHVAAVGCQRWKGWGAGPRHVHDRWVTGGVSILTLAVGILVCLLPFGDWPFARKCHQSAWVSFCLQNYRNRM